MFVAAWTGKKADRAAQTAPSAALAAAEHHAGAGALGVGTQRFLAAGDIGNSSARPPGDAQKKQLNAGAGALGVGTQHFRAAEDIGNSSARPPGNAQKKQLKDTPK